MHLAQIPHDEKEKLETEFKVDLKLFSAARKRETTPDDNRFIRLEAVISFIRQYGNLGSVDEPDEYVEGKLEMRWGPYLADKEKGAPPIYFGGVTDRTIIGMGGSMKHVIGDSGESRAHSHSITPVLLDYLKRQPARAEPVRISEADRDQPPTDSDGWALCAVELATTQMEGPKQQLEFVAKRLLYGRGYSRKKRVLLATPLYVALVE